MTAQEHGFKAEVQQLLDLMVHSLYSDKEIFLRELISNSADALDKVRFIELTRIDLTAAAGEPGIRIDVDKEANTITLEDDGIGMTEEEVVQNLGTIAHSGTSTFLEQLKESKDKGVSDPNLIGQFGVGFYSCFMVAERVEVETLSALPDSTAVRWSSEGKGTYSIEPAERATRGTRITIHLREADVMEYTEITRLQTIVRKHSNFLSWPVHVAGEQANQAKALWHERPSDVEDEEYNLFFRSLAQDWNDPAMRISVDVDSPLQYKALLFIPGRRPYNLFHPDAEQGPRLYAKRVLIDENARDVLPNWLRFVVGVVDSEDIQLNVSREMVQKTPVVRKIREALTKRVLKELGRLAKKEAAAALAEDEPAKVDDTDTDTDTETAEEVVNTYAQIWENFGVVLKEGFLHAPDHRDRLTPLLRFNASSHDDEQGLISLAEYKEAMVEGQEAIWYIAAQNRDSALSSPHLEAFTKRGWDVIILTDTVDEWMIRELSEFDGVPVKSATKGDLGIDGDDEADEAEEEDAVSIGELGPWMTEVFGGEVSDVRASKRLVDSPCVLVDANDSLMSANEERIRRQAREMIPGLGATRVLELNPDHVVVKNLVRMHAAGQTDEAEPIARLLLDDALLLEGTVRDPAAIGRRLQALLARASAAALKQAE